MTFRPAHHLRPILFALLVAAVMILPASQFMVVKVREESMSPTLADGQWVLVLRGSTRVRPGDIAVFVSPLDKQLAVKRCVLEEGAVPVVDHGWLVTPWGRWYLTGAQWKHLNEAGTVPEESVFMVGDNQFSSLDSRSYGSVPRKDLIGRVWKPVLWRTHG